MPDVGNMSIVAQPVDVLARVHDYRLRRKHHNARVRAAEEHAIRECEASESSPSGPLAICRRFLATSTAPDPVLAPPNNDKPMWNAINECSNPIVRHLRAQCWSWNDVIKKLTSLKSRGTPDVGKFHAVLHGIIRHWSSVIQHTELEHVSGKKTCPPPKQQQTLCLLANMCLCGSQERKAMTMLNNLHAIIKRQHKSEEAHKRLFDCEVFFLMIGYDATKGPTGRWLPEDLKEKPHYCRWNVAAHLLRSPWTPQYLELYPAEEVRHHVNYEDKEDGSKTLTSPAGPLELYARDDFRTEYEFAVALQMPCTWYVCFYDMVHSERTVGEIMPDIVEVVIGDAAVHKVYDPRRRTRGGDQLAHVDEWAAAGSDEDDGDDGAPEPDRSSDSSREKVSSGPGSDIVESTGLEFAENEVEEIDIPPPSPGDNDNSSSGSDDSSENKTRNSGDDSMSVDSALGAAVCKVKVPGLGFIAFYTGPKGGFFVAHCGRPEHKHQGHPCKTSRVAYHGRKKGKGRPLVG